MPLNMKHNAGKVVLIRPPGGKWQPVVFFTEERIKSDMLRNLKRYEGYTLMEIDGNANLEITDEALSLLPEMPTNRS